MICDHLIMIGMCKTNQEKISRKQRRHSPKTFQMSKGGKSCYKMPPSINHLGKG